MASWSTCHLGLWLGWQILLNLVMAYALGLSFKILVDFKLLPEFKWNVTDSSRRIMVENNDWMIHIQYDTCNVLDYIILLWTIIHSTDFE